MKLHKMWGTFNSRDIQDFCELNVGVIIEVWQWCGVVLSIHV